MKKTDKPKKAGKIIKKILISFLVVILIIAALLGAYLFYLYTLATDTSEAYKLDTTASTDIYEPLVTSVVTGYRQTITDEQINGIIKKIIDEHINIEENADNDVVVKNVAIYLKKNNRAKLYADLSFHNIRLIYSADIVIGRNELDKTFFLTIGNSKIGKLQISDRVMLKAVSESFEGVSDIIDINWSFIEIPTEYTFEFMDKEVQVEIKDFSITEDGKAMIETSGAMNIISQIIDEMIDDAFSKEE